MDLCRSGLASRIELGDHLWRFELRPPTAEMGEWHPHFVCIKCGQVKCLTDVRIKFEPMGTANPPTFSEVTEILIRGRCDRCA
jgi:Fur family ferric uptake transcriptional regulator